MARKERERVRGRERGREQRDADAGGRGETSLPHITVRDLRIRYEQAQTFEERLGLIHGVRSAILLGDAYAKQARELFERIILLISIGSETSATEMDSELRRQARISLVRYCIPNVLLEPIRRDRCDEEITREWRMSASALMEFFAKDERHCANFHGEELDLVHKLLAARWEGCPQPDDQDDHPGGGTPRAEAGLVERATILRALVHTRHYELLSGIWDAVPLLYAELGRTIHELYPGRPQLEHVEWFPGGLTTRDIRKRLIHNRTTADRFWRNHELILRGCGFSLIHGILRAEPIAKALLELLARLHSALDRVQ